MPSELLNTLIERMRALHLDPPTSLLLHDQVGQLAAQVARSTGASVRVSATPQLQVLFAGPAAAVATSQFRRLADQQVPDWAQQVAAEVVGRLS